MVVIWPSCIPHSSSSSSSSSSSITLLNSFKTFFNTQNLSLSPSFVLFPFSLSPFFVIFFLFLSQISMETFPSASSFETNHTFQTRNNLRDASFSSYLNKSEENMILKLTNSRRNESEEDEEIGVFGAEKYFKGEIDEKEKEKDRRFIDPTTKIHQQHKKDEEFDQILPAKPRTDRTNTRTPSVQSETSWNSRSGLLPRASPQNQSRYRNTEKGSKTRAFLASLGCNCIDKKSTEVSDKRILKPPMKTLDSEPKTEPLPSKWPERGTRDDFFSFPVLNSNSKPENLAGNGSPLILERKLSLLSDWDVGISREDEMYNDDGAETDASSDLFEIESLSTNGKSLVLANDYAPSEVSIEWSVVTASAADLSVASDFDEVRTGGGGGARDSGRRGSKEKQKKRPGILSGCKSHKSVRVAGDECRVMGGEKAVGGGGGPGGWRRRSDSTVVGRGNYGSDGCSVAELRPYASRLLYIQQ